MRSIETQIVVGITLNGPIKLTTHEQIMTFIEKLPEQFGEITLQDARVLRGMVNEDDVPMEPCKASNKKYKL